MAITRTPIIDDSGGGTDGTVIDNAWKQELYNQIDALLGGGGISAALVWTPIDVSGAALVFPAKAGRYVKVGPLVAVGMNLTFPATANASPVTIGGLPFPARHLISGFYTTYGPTNLYFLSQNQTGFNALNPSSMAPRTNAELSGATINVFGIYFTD